MVDGTATLILPPARPPTPPKDRVDASPSAHHDGPHLLNPQPQSLLDTPTESPKSSAEYFGDAFGKSVKKVDFSPWNQSYKPTHIGSKSPEPNRALRNLPPSRERKCAKSILKRPSNNSSFAFPLSSPSADANTMASLILKTLNHLAQASQVERLEIYTIAQGHLHTLAGLEHPEKLIPEVGALWRILGQDLAGKSTDMYQGDNEMMETLLRLLITIMNVPMWETEVPKSLRHQLLKQALSAIQDDRNPSALVIQYLQILARSSMVDLLTKDQIGSLFVALDKVVRVYKNNRILTLRIMVYQSLFKHSQAQFILDTQWIDHVIAGVLSSHKEIRTRTIAFGSAAALSLGTNSTVSKEWTDTMSRRGKEDQTVFEHVTHRMKAMVQVKGESTHVPQIWSLVTLFLRSRPRFIERWEYFKPWLGVLQTCFNASDFETKVQANIAWDKLVMAVKPDLSTSPAMIGVLSQPIASQLDRKPSHKRMKQSRASAKSSLCNLLIYALRPGTNYEHLDLYWDKYIFELASKVISRSPSDVGFFCRILTALFTNVSPRPWEEDVAIRYQFKAPEQLPCLEPKWARSRVSKIMKVYELLDMPAAWRSDSSDKATLETAWRAYMSTVGLAGSKEIKVSMDSMTVVAAVLNYIGRSVSRPAEAQPASNTQNLLSACQITHICVDGAISGIGHLPFNEARIARSSQQTFIAAETPSSRSSKHHGVLNTPICHILLMLLGLDCSLRPTTELKLVMEQLVAASLRHAASRSKEFATLRHLVSTTVQSDDARIENALCLWEVLSSSAADRLMSPRTIFNGESPPPIGHELRDCTKVLEAAINLRDMPLSSNWDSLLSIMRTAVIRETSDEALNLVLVEPLSLAVLRKLSIESNVFLLHSVTQLLPIAVWPSSSHAMKRACKMLWESDTFASQPSCLQPFEHLHALIQKTLGLLYEQPDSAYLEMIPTMLKNVAHFIEKCPVEQVLTLLQYITPMITIWIEDRNEKVTEASFGKVAKPCMAALNILWNAVRAIIGKLDVDLQNLRQISLIFAAALGSHHRSIASSAISVWNSTYGQLEDAEYSCPLATALRRVRQLAEVDAPGLGTNEDFEEQEYANFVDSPGEESTSQSRIVEPPPQTLPSSTQSRERRLSIEPTKIGERNHQKERYQGPTKRTYAKTPPKAKLRHDDSQIQFAAIDSSPIQRDEDSQTLTERQKEVKERQSRNMGNLFPQINSSPLPRISRMVTTLPRFSLSETDSSFLDDAMEDDASPILPSTDMLSVENLGSSPTPSSVRAPAAGQDDEIPSSPPPTPSNFGTPSFLNDDPHQDTVLQSPEGPLNHRKSRASTRLPHQERTASLIPSSANESEETSLLPKSRSSNAMTEIPMRSEPSPACGNTNQPMDTAFSDGDIFVDASTQKADLIISSNSLPPADIGDSSGLYLPVAGNQGDHAEGLLTFDNNTDTTSQVTDSILQDPEDSSADDDRKLEEQLAKELEHASQNSSFAKASPKVPNKKRKADADDTPRHRKKAKQRRASKKVEVVIDALESSAREGDFVRIETPRAAKQASNVIANEEAVKVTANIEPEVASPSIKRSLKTASSSTDTARSPVGKGKGKVRARLSLDQDKTMTSPEKQATLKHALKADEQTNLTEGSQNMSPPTIRRSSRLAQGSNVAGESPAIASTELGESNMNEQRDGGASKKQKIGHDTDDTLPDFLPAEIPSTPPTADYTHESTAEQAPKTAAAILADFQASLADLKSAALGAEEERELVATAFEIVKEAHEAGRRSHGRS